MNDQPPNDPRMWVRPVQALWYDVAGFSRFRGLIMSTDVQLRRPKIIYPESDGQPVAENTLQFRWIVTLEGNLEGIFQDDPNVFVAGDLLWYPVEGDNTIRTAPDAMVVFGRPKGDRGSYQQWLEDDIAPQVVFEVLSPGNRHGEMIRKFRFYEQYGVDEYYVYDPDHLELNGWLRSGDVLREIPNMNGWVSPRLGIRFESSGDDLRLYTPDGRPFLTFQELLQQSQKETQRADTERQRADNERQRAENEQARAERLAAQLRSLGVNPAD
jgi:Uma2 family endonuclease